MIVLAKEVQKNFGQFRALKNFSLHIEGGECFGLLGPNGAGKSTFISLLYGAKNRDGGNLTVFGLDPDNNKKTLRDIKKRIGVVTQDNALDEGLTILENMSIYASFQGLDSAQSSKKILSLLEEFAILNKKDSVIRTLSGGMKRRLVFVRALLGEPELLILDEPTTGLDPAVRSLLWEKVREIKNRGTTILLTTHYMHEAEALCDRIVIMNQGESQSEGSPHQLMTKHSPGFKAKFPLHAKSSIENLLGNGEHLLLSSDHVLVSAPDLERLLEIQNAINIKALQLRPSNLEDVFLKLTGEELDNNA